MCAATTPAGGPTLADAAAFNAQDHSQTDHNWDLTALARYAPDATQTYEAGVAQKTRSPNLYERYTWSTWTMAAVMNNFVGDGNGYVGDINLKPEVAHTLSLAADWHDAGQETWGVRVAPYYTHVRDYIDARCLAASCPDGQFNVLRFVNQSARLYGVDISGHVLAAQHACVWRLHRERHRECHPGREPGYGRQPVQHHALERETGADAKTGTPDQYAGSAICRGEKQGLGRQERDRDRRLQPAQPAQQLSVEAGPPGRRHRQPVRQGLCAAAGRRLCRPGHDDVDQRDPLGHRRPRPRPLDLCRR